MSESASSVSWHCGTSETVLARLGASAEGLSSAQAAERLASSGRNVLPHRPPPAWWQFALRQFQSPLIYILAVAALVSVAIGDAGDAGFIAVVLAVNATIGGVQEWRAERSSRALQQLLAVRASVLRDGDWRELDAEELAPGDVVALESGNRVPADLRLLEAHALEVDESLLTGESLAVAKDARWQGEADAPLAERLNMAHAGSSIVRGRARGVVVATAGRTAVGQLALDIASGGGRPPLLERMERFTRAIAISVLVASAVVGVLGVALRGYGVSDMFLFAVALAVSAIPEGLPVALTVALSIASARMARRGVIVRRLAAVEGLGSCTLIASDKTGTLTCNELTVRVASLPDGRELDVSGEGYSPEGEVSVDAAARPSLERLARAVVLCNEGQLQRRNGEWTWRGDPTDVALLVFGHKAGVTREEELALAPLVDAIAFEPERQFAATFHRAASGDQRVFVKGAPERVLAMCALDHAARERIAEQSAALAARGFRVLAVAEGIAQPDQESEGVAADPSALEFLGLVSMIDPLRAGAREAVQRCREAGIAVSMITGDHPVTALAIARDAGFAERADQVVTGRELAQLGPEEMVEVVNRVRVFARATPRQKLELVDAARRAGHFVAVTGDGVNDAPALRRANIGVAMGRSGTDVAREAAELVISDDNFATLVAGVEEGRVAYDNVRKVVYLSLSTGAAEVLTLGLAVATGWPAIDGGAAVLPLLPVQILWLNLVTNGIQDVALAFEPSEGDVLRRAPRPPSEPLVDRLMIQRTVLAASVMSIVGFGAFCWMVEVAGWTPERSRNALLLLMVLFQNLHIGNCRSETRSVFQLSPLRSPVLLAGTAAAFLLHIAAMHTPLLQRILALEPVDLPTLAALALAASSILVAMEAHKAWVRLRSR